MSHPEPIVLDLTAAQYLQLEEFFNHVQAEHDAGRTGMLLAQIGIGEHGFDRTKMKIGFLPAEKAKQFAVGSGWHATLESPSQDAVTDQS